MLKSEIEISGQTQAQWAAALGGSAPFLSLILSGRRLPGLELAGKSEAMTEGRVPAGAWFLGADARSVPEGRGAA